MLQKRREYKVLRFCNIDVYFDRVNYVFTSAKEKVKKKSLSFCFYKEKKLVSNCFEKFYLPTFDSDVAIKK